MIFSHFASPMVHVVGDGLRARLEDSSNRERRDHVWILVDVGLPQRIEVPVNIYSVRNDYAGFDPRVRVGILRMEWLHLPHRGMQEWDRFDYQDWETHHNVFYEFYERAALSELILEMVAQAQLLEVWGTPYRSQRNGVHQIHSRRASCAVAEDIVGRDGALKFYFEAGQEARMVFLKFCGQT